MRVSERASGRAGERARGRVGERAKGTRGGSGSAGVSLARGVWALLVMLALVLGCAPRNQEVLPEPGRVQPTPMPPVSLPADDAPHDVLMEWWYYTGHLGTAQGERYGFEFVIFQSIRGDNPVGYLSHFAVTDRGRERFQYDMRVGQRESIPETLDLEVDGWTLRGGGGQDRIAADMGEYALELELESLKPAALHHGGLIDYGPAGPSYYYSRTNMAAEGRLRVDGRWQEVEGRAWFDHQWGDFVVPSAGGWDWFSLQLEGERELMVTVLRDERGQTAAVFGSYVTPDGRTVELAQGALEIEALATWTSPHTGAVYPSGWQVRLQPQPELPAAHLQVIPVLQDQELAFEWMPYWEGAVDVSGTLEGQAVSGEGYVELTGYR